MDTELMETLRKALEEDLASIERQLAEYGAGENGEYSVAPADEGFADSAHATAERAERLSHIDQLVSGRDEITSALARMEAGTYGTCERCGKPISPERLEALPTATLCLDCKRKA